jgi:1-acyl-sn-glycerol-3-phosphate acyltransferase
MTSHRAKTAMSTRSARGIQVPALSPLLWHLFGRYARRYLSRAFHTVRLSGLDMVGPPVDLPLIVYINHPSWWDPLLCLFLAQYLWPERTHYAPMQAVALERYRFFKRLGFFGVQSGTRQGGLTFLRVSQAILQQPATALWVTPEGRFTDPRQRPVHLLPGIGHLAARLRQGVLLPVALEYPFWEERLPEALVRIGEPCRVGDVAPGDTAAWTQHLAGELERTQNALAHDACYRHADAFRVILRGRVSIGGVYDMWRALRARWRGESFTRQHGDASP